MHYLGSNLSQFHGNLYVYVVYHWVQEILNTGSLSRILGKGPVKGVLLRRCHTTDMP